MFEQIINWIKKLFEKEKVVKDDEENILSMKSAINELKHAENILNNTNNPDLIDYALHRMSAAQSLINHLSRRAKANEEKQNNQSKEMFGERHQGV